MAPSTPPASSISKSKSKRSNHRHTLSLQKTEVIINVYDLLPPSRFSSLLWTLGTAFLHSGVQINNREYAYGGHTQPSLTGVYYTPPQSCPPGGTFKTSILHGLTFHTPAEIDKIIKEAAEVFKGREYNLLSRNCNHFTDYLVRRLTGKGAPGWLNRAAGVGRGLPCLVPAEWVTVPTADEGEGIVGDDDGGSASTERSSMLRNMDRASVDEASDVRQMSNLVNVGGDGSTAIGKGKEPVRDTSGRKLPPAETAPVPSCQGSRSTR